MSVQRPDILSGTQISVNFRGLKALQGVDIGVPEGGIVGLVGPNGAGKSTLLGVLSGDVRAQHGVVRLGGKDVSGLAPETRVRRGLARTFQLPQLFDELTVREHLTLPRRLAQAPSREWSDPLTGRYLHRDVPEEQEVDALLASLGLVLTVNCAVINDALAQQPTQQQRNAIRASCRSDFISNCAGVEPGGVGASDEGGARHPGGVRHRLSLPYQP